MNLRESAERLVELLEAYRDRDLALDGPEADEIRQLLWKLKPVYRETNRAAGFRPDLPIFVWYPRTLEAARDVRAFLRSMPGWAPTSSIPETVAQGRPQPSGNRSAFLLMPFSTEFDWLRNELVAAGVEADTRIVRADDIFRAGVVIEQVRDALAAADAVIAVCTDRNANVFFELGLAQMLGHKPILVARDRSDLPFDIQHLRAHFYGSGPDSPRDLRASVSQALQETIAERKARQETQRGALLGTEGRAVVKPPSLPLSQRFGRWLPSSSHALLPSESGGMVVRTALAAVASESMPVRRIDDGVREAMVRVLSDSSLVYWLLTQLDFLGTIEVTGAWNAEGPNNTSRGATLVWRTSPPHEVQTGAAQAVLAQPGGERPVLLIDVAFPATHQDAGAGKGMPDWQIPLFRVKTLLDSLVVTVCRLGSDVVFPTLFDSVVPNEGPVVFMTALSGRVDDYIDLRGARRIPGTSTPTSTLFEPDAGVDLRDAESRQEQVMQWLQELLLDAGVADSKAIVANL